MTNQITVGLGLLFAFGVGCGTGADVAGGVAAEVVEAPAHAHETQAARLEYRCIHETNPDDLTTKATNAGAPGAD